MKRKWCVFSLMLGVWLTGCAPKAEEVKTEFYAMDTYMTMTGYGDEGRAAMEVAETTIKEREKLWTVREPVGEVARLNDQGHMALSQPTYDLVKKALHYAAETGGAFDATIYPVVCCWGFGTDHPAVPHPKVLQTALQSVGSDRVTWSDDTREVILAEGQALDLGGIAKGAATDEAVTIFREKGASSALLSLGGNVYAIGEKPDGSAWRVAVADPDGEGYAGVLQVRDTAVVTSGGYERHFEEDGETYHHVLSPQTGYPVGGANHSVTILCTDATRADAYSTALLVMGREAATEFWQERAETFSFVWCEDDHVWATENLQASLTSEKDVTWIKGMV